MKVEVNQEIAEELVAATHSPDIERVKIHHPGLPLHVCRGDDDSHTTSYFIWQAICSPHASHTPQKSVPLGLETPSSIWNRLTE